MGELVFFLEEPSAEEMLKGLLPRILPPSLRFRCVVFEGKQDLEKRLGRHLRANCRAGNRCIVLRDQDSAVCTVVKARLAGIAAGVAVEPLIRIACRELESWYLADLAAVEQGLGLKNPAKLQGKEKFREPDRLGSPSRELAELTRGRYQKIAGSRAIGRLLDPENTRSASFRNFVGGVRRLAAAAG